ncbi:ArsR/SmtB family transcription factor [Deinococcus sp.]|uniref:ArsR/SmtB family transcription factor n=1 Tax=Deinococcus sp. TaxID=47478 RepID=UPI003C7C5CE6
MTDYPNIAPVAALLAEPARAAMLVALLAGRALPAGELAFLAGVSPQTASSHLGKLVEGHLLAVEAHGRHRYYRLSGSPVAHAVEALAAVAPLPERRTPRPDERAQELRYARTCYDHLAGHLGVQVTEALLGLGVLAQQESGYEVSPAGQGWLSGFGVDVAALRPGRRPLARPCLDWSERRPHLAGALGQALLTRLLELEWMVRIPGGRALRVAQAGRRGLLSTLALRL